MRISWESWSGFHVSPEQNSIWIKRFKYIVEFRQNLKKNFISIFRKISPESLVDCCQNLWLVLSESFLIISSEYWTPFHQILEQHSVRIPSWIPSNSFLFAEFFEIFYYFFHNFLRGIQRSIFLTSNFLNLKKKNKNVANGLKMDFHRLTDW